MFHENMKALGETMKNITIPRIGLGTFGSDHISSESIARSVEFAIRNGYRHIDCASVYGNEKEIGTVIARLIAQGVVKREDLWITSKLWNDKHDEKDVIASCKRSLADLQLEYLDLYIIHWPFPNFHPPKCDITMRSPNAKPYIHENYMKTWRKLEELFDSGSVRHIGCSNMTIAKMKLLLRDARIKPECTELEMHPHFQQNALRTFLQKNDIVPIAYSPLGSPSRPERDRSTDDTCDMEDPVIMSIAQKHAVHPASICLKWASQCGAIPIPFSTSERNIASNLKAVHEDPLTEGELEAIFKIDKNCRLIKGHVFLWKDNQTWEDLWDIDGNIAE